MQEVDLDALSPEHRSLVDAGIYSATPGEGGLPVLRWAVGPQIGQFVKGGGRPPGSPDIAEISRRTAYKRTDEYRALVQKYLPADIESGKRGSLGWLLDQGLVAIEGGDVPREIHCPECGHEWTQSFYKKPDSLALKLILELLVGRATEMKEVNVSTEQLLRVVDERRDARDIVVFAVDPTERARREALSSDWED